MNLYLSSVGLPHKDVFRGLFSSKKKPVIGFIANGWDVYPAEKADSFLTSTSGALTEAGCVIRSIDLTNFADKPASMIKTELDGVDGVWITGGNSFYLNWLMRQSHFDQAIKALISEEFVYGGESAGACIAGPSLRGAQYIDDIKQAPSVIWDGFGLVDFGIVPHWGEPKYAELLTRFRDELAKHAKVTELANGQAVVVHGSSVTVSV